MGGVRGGDDTATIGLCSASMHALATGREPLTGGEEPARPDRYMQGSSMQADGVRSIRITSRVRWVRPPENTSVRTSQAHRPNARTNSKQEMSS